MKLLATEEDLFKAQEALRVKEKDLAAVEAEIDELKKRYEVCH